MAQATGSGQKRNLKVPLIVLAGLGLVVALVLFFVLTGGGGDDNGDQTNLQTMAGNMETVDTCDKPDSFFDIQYQSHAGGFIIDDGLPVDPVAALAKIALVTAQDTNVLRYFANDILAARFGDDFGPIPEEKDLTILATRKEEWQRFCHFMTDEKVLLVVVELEGEIGNHIMSADGEQVSESTDQVAPGEQGIAIVYKGNGDNAAVLRAICSNLITENPPVVKVTPTPGEEVPPNTPTPTSPVDNTPPPSPTDTPVNTPPERQTATPTNTPRNTPPPPPSQTPAPTFTPPAPCCPTAVNTPPADGGTPIRPTATPRPTRTPLPEPTQDRPDPVLPTPVSVF